MYKDKRNKNILITILSIISLIMAIMNNSYLVSCLYVGTIIVYMLIDDESKFYDFFYGIFLITTIFDYVLYIPKVSNIYLFHIVVLLFTLYTLYTIFKNMYIIDKINKKVILIYIIWFVYMCVSVTWAKNRMLSIKFLAIYVLMFTFVFDFMVYNINKARLKRTIMLIVGLVSFISIIGIIESLIGYQLPVVHHYDGMKLMNTYSHNSLKSRPIAFSFNPNNLAATLGILTPICFVAINECRNTIGKAFAFLMSIVSFTVIILTTSRTGFAAILFGFVSYMVYSFISAKREKKGLSAVILPLLLVVAFSISYSYGYKLLNVRDSDNRRMQSSNDMQNKVDDIDGTDITIGGEGSINVRVTIINDVINDFIVNKNYRGNGVGNVQQFIKDNDNTAGIYSPHCYPAEILCEFGIFGVLLYGVFYLYIFISNIILGIKKKNAWCIASACSLIAFAPACFGPSSITYIFSYWIMIGFAVATIQSAKNGEDYRWGGSR